jgi:glycosyltransferase involved in cell wall biosynthesis
MKRVEPSERREAHLVLMVTSPMTTVFFRGQIARLRQAGFRVTFICDPGPQTSAMSAEGAQVIAVPMQRDIALLSDLVSLWTLWRTLRRIRPDIINVGTPKAGLLGGIAARLAGVPHRVYTVHGLRLETVRGWKRFVLGLAERAACANAQRVRFVSPSLREKAIELGLVAPEKAFVVASGTSNGVDVERFRSTPERTTAARGLRGSLNIPANAPVIGFVGRLTRDKGIPELCGAYYRLKPSFPDLHLLLVGDFEDGDPVDPAIRARLQRDQSVHLTGDVPDAAPYYPLMNVVALPTHREGFPNVPLEAQAASVPVVTTTATGAADSVLDGITGRVVPVHDQAALATALHEMIINPERSRQMGQTAPEWVNANFKRERFWQALIEFYEDVLGRRTGTTESAIKEVFPSTNIARAASRPPKILIVATVHRFLEAFILPFARHYRDQGWIVEAFSRDAGSSELCRGAFDRVWDASWSRTPLNVRGNVRSAACLRRLVREGGYDLIHVHTPVASFVTRATLHYSQRHPPVIYSAHGFHFFEGGPWRRNLVFRELEKAAGRWTDALVVVNRDDEAAVRRHHIVNDEQLFYIPGLGIDLRRYSQDSVSEGAVNRLRAELGISEAERVLLQVAELIPRKRPEDTLRAFARAGVTCRLLLAGDGPLEASLRSLAVSLGIQDRVVFLGMRRDVPVLLKLADALILVSNQEGLPQCVMEAMAMSKPVIGSDIRGMRDLLSGGAGVLVPVGNIAAIADAITMILDNPGQAREIACRGRDRIPTYDLRYILKLHDELYDRVLAESRASRHSASAQVAL